MRTRTTTAITAGAIAVAGAVTGAVIWLGQPSYNDIVKGCQKALATQSKAGGMGKPSACKGVKNDDYDTLVLNNAINGLGWTDKDGNVDENKMLNDATSQP